MNDFRKEAAVFGWASLAIGLLGIAACILLLSLPGSSGDVAALIALEMLFSAVWAVAGIGILHLQRWAVGVSLALAYMKTCISGLGCLVIAASGGTAGGLAFGALLGMWLVGRGHRTWKAAGTAPASPTLASA